MKKVLAFMLAAVMLFSLAGGALASGEPAASAEAAAEMPDSEMIAEEPAQTQAEAVGTEEAAAEAPADEQPEAPAADGEAVSGTCGDNLTWTLQDGVLTVSGTGAMDNYYGNTPWGGYSSEITEAVIEKGVTCIGDYAFSRCSKMSKVSIPDSVTKIGFAAFESCTGLTKVTIGSSVTSIGAYAFEKCNNLTTVVFTGDIPSLESDCFKNLDIAIYYPAENDSWTNCSALEPGASSWYYKPYWSESSKAAVSDSGKCGNDLTWTLTNKVLTISGKGDMYDYKLPALAPWHSCDYAIEKVVIEDGVTSIGDGAFLGCDGMTQINIPDSVTSIGSYAFESCESLTSVYIPTAVTTITSRYYSSTLNADYSPFKDCSADLIIYCGADDVQSGWDTYWNNYYFYDSYKLTVRYGVSREEYEQIIAVVPGDLGGDGRVTVLDALELFRAVAGLQDMPSPALGDLNSDGVVDIGDALRLFLYVNGQIDTL